MGGLEVAEGYERSLARAGISDYAAAMGWTRGHLVSAHRGRSVVRIEGSLYLKRFIDRPREARRERRAMELLASGPGPDSVPLVAWGEGKLGAFLLTAAPRGSRPLPDAMRVLEGKPRRRLVRAVASSVRALHDRGLTCPDLLAHHLLVSLPDRVWLIDAARLRRRTGRRARARDLAALELSLPCGADRFSDRARFLAAYAGPGGGERRSWIAAVEREYHRLDRRSRHRTDRVLAAPDDLAFLRGHGIESFDDLHGYAGPGAARLRALPDRENWRVSLAGRVFFVKRHRPVKGLSRTPARAEWEAVRVLRRAGIRCMRPLAMGEDVRKGSTIWVERSAGEPLDDLLRRGVAPALRRELVLEAAGILRRMRLREIHHRDMYLCHLFADPGAPAGERLTVIDLQRSRRIPGLRGRWFVKDVAQLLHSAPRPPVTGADLARFLRAYFAVGKLGPAEKAFARRVSRKAAWIRRRSREPFER
jgi:hypothetical protein